MIRFKNVKMGGEGKVGSFLPRNLLFSYDFNIFDTFGGWLTATLVMLSQQAAIRFVK